MLDDNPEQKQDMNRHKLGAVTLLEKGETLDISAHMNNRAAMRALRPVSGALGSKAEAAAL